MQRQLSDRTIYIISLGSLRDARARKTLGFLRCATLAVRACFRSFMVQSEQWDTYWGPKKLIFLIRDIDDATMAGASVESCQFVVLRSP